MLSAPALAQPPVAGKAQVTLPANLIPNGDFQKGPLGGLPDGWRVQAARTTLKPEFKLVQEPGGKMLLAAGNGNPDCAGYVAVRSPVVLGKTYRFHALFRISEGLNPHDNLLFQAIGPGAYDGIHAFRRLRDGWVEGETKITYHGQGAGQAEIRLYFRLSPQGKTWIKQLALTETTPTPPRWVKVACTNGGTDLAGEKAVLEAAGKAKADLVLLTEYMQGKLIPEPLDGPSCKLMAAQARKHRMYVAGGIVRTTSEDDRMYNTVVLFDRQGKLLGMYDKHHPYSPEVNDEGITPGIEVPVFRTDFGTIGVMTCYDSWFTDVAQLLGLKGAEIVLFPNAGYYRSLMPARAADNKLRIVSSSGMCGYGVWDTAGRSVLQPDADPTVCVFDDRPTFKDVVQSKVGNVDLLVVSLDLEASPSPHVNGGTMRSSPGGRRNRAEQKTYLEDEIKRERQRWWVE